MIVSKIKTILRLLR